VYSLLLNSINCCFVFRAKFMLFIGETNSCKANQAAVSVILWYSYLLFFLDLIKYSSCLKCQVWSSGLCHRLVGGYRRFGVAYRLLKTETTEHSLE
jgi:hypothetical protein